METIHDIIKTHSDGKGVGMMWQTTKMISDAIEADMPKESADRLKRDLYALMCGGHFNEDFAREAVRRMYYTEEEGERMYAPYWSEATVRGIYEDVKDEFDDLAVSNHESEYYNGLIETWLADDSVKKYPENYAGIVG